MFCECAPNAADAARVMFGISFDDLDVEEETTAPIML